MNQISSALAQAGVKLPPLTQRVWQLLHDSKLPRSAKTVSQLLNLKAGDVASCLTKLTERKMVEKQFQLLSVKTGRGMAKRDVAHYVALGSKYELLPPVRANKTKPPARPDVEQRFLRSQITPPAPRATTIDIEKMTLGEARALYEQLKKVFG